MNFVTKEPINKGWSSDKKYCVTDENGTRYLLRVSDIAQHDTKQSEFNMMKQVASFGVPMCQPIEFGICEDGVYSIQSWIDGEDAEQVMSGYSDTEQYVYGLEAGRILRIILFSVRSPSFTAIVFILKLGIAVQNLCSRFSNDLCFRRSCTGFYLHLNLCIMGFLFFQMSSISAHA